MAPDIKRLENRLSPYHTYLCIFGTWLTAITSLAIFSVTNCSNAWGLGCGVGWTAFMLLLFIPPFSATMFCLTLLPRLETHLPSKKIACRAMVKNACNHKESGVIEIAHANKTGHLVIAVHLDDEGAAKDGKNDAATVTSIISMIQSWS